MKRTCLILLAVIMIMNLLVGCAPSTSKTSDEPKSSTAPSTNVGEDTDTKETSDDTVLVGWNNYMEGAYLTTIEGMLAESTYEALGGYKTMSVNDEALLEVATDNIKTMISAGCNALQAFSVWESHTITLNDECLKNKIPFVMNDIMPTNDDIIAKLQENPYFVGCVGTNNYSAGSERAEYAGKAGLKYSLIVNGGIGTLSSDQKSAGYQETFEKYGGEVVAAVRTDSPDDVTSQVENALLAHPEIDSVYCGQGLLFAGMMAAIEKHPDMDIKVMVDDAEIAVIEGVEDGSVWIAGGGQHIVGLFAAVMMDKWLSGDPFLDENGLPPIVDAVHYITLTKDNCKFYRKYWLDGASPYTAEEVKALADMSWDDFNAAMNQYSMKERMNALYENGVITAEELEASGVND